MVKIKQKVVTILFPNGICSMSTNSVKPKHEIFLIQNFINKLNTLNWLVKLLSFFFFFTQRKSNFIRKESLCMTNFTKTDKKFLKASYLASLRIVKEGKPNTIIEILLLPAAKDMVLGGLR